MKFLLIIAAVVCVWVVMVAALGIWATITVSKMEDDGTLYKPN